MGCLKVESVGEEQKALVCNLLGTVPGIIKCACNSTQVKLRSN